MADAILLLLRAWVGVVMVAHGYNHATSLDGTTRWFRSKGFRSARLVAAASGAGELAAGIGLLAGFLTPIAAAGVVVVAVTAFWTIHRFAGFFVFSRPDEGWEYVATLAVASTVIAALGPGRFSLDHLLGWQRHGATGLWIIGAGVVFAALQLLALWRRPEE